MAKTTIFLTGDLQNSVFDAATGVTFRFSYSGNQVVGNRLTIRENATDVVVYDNYVDNMRLEHKLPAFSLANGTTYNAQVTVIYRNFDGSSIEDAPSYPVVFNCFASPLVEFVNLADGQTVGNSEYELTIHYTQEQGDLPNRYIVRLFNSYQTEIWNSGEIYPQSPISDFTASSTIYDLLNTTEYYVSCEFESLSGMQGSTGLVHFLVSYLKPRSYSTLYLENVPSEYAIKINSNIKVIDGIIDGPNPTYIDDQMIDLSSGETRVSWVDFGVIDSDFQIMLEVAHNEEEYKDILEIGNGSHKVVVKMMRGVLYGDPAEVMYAVLYSTVGDTQYMTISNTMPVPAHMERYIVSLVHQGKFYRISLIQEGGG